MDFYFCSLCFFLSISIYLIFYFLFCSLAIRQENRFFIFPILSSKAIWFLYIIYRVFSYSFYFSFFYSSDTCYNLFVNALSSASFISSYSNNILSLFIPTFLSPNSIYSIIEFMGMTVWSLMGEDLLSFLYCGFSNAGKSSSSSIDDQIPSDYE